MKRFKFDKPLVESPYPPSNTNVLWVDVDEKSGKIASIKQYNTTTNLWETQLDDSIVDLFKPGFIKNNFILPVLEINLKEIVNECNAFINNLTDLETDDTDGYLFVSSIKIPENIKTCLETYGSIILKDISGQWYVGSSDPNMVENSKYKPFRAIGYKIPNYETVSQTIGFTPKHEPTTALIYTDTYKHKILVCNILDKRLGYYQPFADSVDYSAVRETGLVSLARGNNICKAGKINKHDTVICEIGYLISTADRDTNYNNYELSEPLICIKFQKLS